MRSRSAEFFTVTSRAAPAGVAGSTETSTSIAVDESRPTAFTVTPVPSTETVAPEWKPAPVMPMSWCAAPCPRELGLTDMMDKVRVPRSKC